MVNIEPGKLGRPWHKLPKLMNDSFDILDARLSIYFLKKLRVNAALKAMDFSIDRLYKNTLVFSTAYGNVAFSIDRILLLNILHDYYGLSKDSNHVAPDESVRVTKTEERLKCKLGQELTQLVLCKETFGEELDIKVDYSTVINHWSWCITFTLEGYQHGTFSVLLDHHHVDHMLALLRAPTENVNNLSKGAKISSAQIEQLFYSLPIKLTGRLASLNLTVAHIADINPGDIIPFAINDPVPVFIGKEQIFETTIVEDRQKLFFCNIYDKATEK